MKAVRLSDIAKKTGYSINTVSHALLDKPDISEKTKKYIQQTAAEMGYIANASAGALRSGKSKTVALIVGDISNPHFSIMLKEMEGRLRHYGYNAIMLNTDEDEALEHAAIVSAISKNVDGIILCPVQKTRDNIGFIAKKRIPYVLLGRRFEGNPSSDVICDDLNGGYAAAEHLIGLGHKKLLFINAPLYISSARDRLEGVKRAMVQGGLSPEALYCAETVPAPDKKEVMACLKKHKDCTGIICFSDMLAMQVCCFLQKLGKKVPDDVSVIGFDDIASKFYLPLMLTSVTSSKTKMSMEAVDILMHVIQNKTEQTTQIVLPTHVVQRESTKER